MAETIVALTAAAAAAAPTLATTAATTGAVLGAAGTIYSGVQAKRSADFEARQLEARGDEEFAASQRRAMQARREKQLVQSRIQSVAAASGAGAGDHSVTALMEGVEEQGAYNQMLELYQGRSDRHKAYAGASARRAQGRSKLTGSIITAAGKLGSSIYSAKS